MKRMYFFVLVALIPTLSLIAEDNWVEVKKSDDALNIYAKGIGSGNSLEAAKLDAINKVLPQLISKTLNVPGSYQSHMSVNGVETAEGIDNIAGKTFMQGYWKLEDGKYTYKIELLIDTSNQ